MTHLSVIIPTYNRAPFLTAAIQSVLDQVCSDAQIIVVDDGSTDDTQAILDHFADRIEVRKRLNSGPGAARNTGLAASKGDLIAFLDSDDLWTPDHLSCLQALLIENPKVNLAFGRTVEFVQEDGGMILHPKIKPGLVVGAMLAQRAAFERVGMFREDLVLGEFIDWARRAREIGVKSGLIEQVVLYRRVHPGNIGQVQREDQGDYALVVREALKRRGISSGPTAGAS